jgi:hypothetical protein
MEFLYGAVGIVGFVVLMYLFVSLLKPEWFG